MGFKEISLIIAVVVFVLYVAYVWGRFGIQKSISISYYEFPNGDRWAFRVFIWILSLAIILAGIGWGTPFFLLGGGLLSLVGFFSRIKVKRKFIVHMVGAIGGILSCYIGVLVMDLKLGLVAGGCIIIQSLACYIYGRKEHYIWNIEIACFTWLMGSLLYLTL